MSSTRSKSPCPSVLVDDDLDGVPLDCDALLPPPSPPARASVLPPYFRRFQQYWQRHVSKRRPPHLWYHQQHPDPNFTAAATHDAAPLIGCTLTLTLPDATTTVFRTEAHHPSRRDARDAAFALAWHSAVHESARALRDRLGWDSEQDPPRDQQKRTQAQGGGPRPWDTLRLEGERWRAEPVRWEFQEDLLNTTHGCRLTVPVSPESTLTFTTPATFPSHRLAKDAAARLALEAGVVAQYEAAYKDRLTRESGGQLRFETASVDDESTQTEPGRAEEGNGETKESQQQQRKRQRSSELDPVLLLQTQVREAFGGVHPHVEWTFSSSDPQTDKGPRTRSNWSCTLKLVFPSPAPFPYPDPPPPPLIVSTPAEFRTKQLARSSCATLAFRHGIVELLKPYQVARARHLEALRTEPHPRGEPSGRSEREGIAVSASGAGPSRIPRAGTLAYDELEGLDNPTAYLNLCAQQWTGSSSPLTFEYSTEDPPPGIRGKYHGCTLRVQIDRLVSRAYTVPSSPATPTRTSAKLAAVRLALRERVLDLMQPVESSGECGTAAVDEDGTGSYRKAKRARKEDVRVAEDEVEESRDGTTIGLEGCAMTGPSALAHPDEPRLKVPGHARRVEDLASRPSMDGSRRLQDSHEYDQRGSGSAVEQLRQGCEARTGQRPRYQVGQKDSHVSATVYVPLDPCGGEATRAFAVPAGSGTGDVNAAREAAARAALEAGILKLIAARQGELLRGGRCSFAAARRPAAGTAPSRSREEQAGLCRARYGGLGAAEAGVGSGAAGNPSAELNRKGSAGEGPGSHPAPINTSGEQQQQEKAEEQYSFPGLPAPDASRMASGASSILEAVPEGPAVSALQAYCRSKAFPPPVLHHHELPRGTPPVPPTHRVWLVLRDQRFELPAVKGTAARARERLAAKVLQHLRANEA